MQKLVINESGGEEWIHYCIVLSVEQAVQTVAQKEPTAEAQARADLIGGVVLGSMDAPLSDARRDTIAKALRGWQSNAKLTPD
ncbi:MAG: hypothetical protein HC872_06290 [Gammaproteobacteria bacterium]|nr:hypothetical protein [Gammaproteobacteria bacterium]